MNAFGRSRALGWGIALIAGLLAPAATLAALPPELDFGAFTALDTLPPSPLVQRTQEALAALGAYRGPINGRLTDDTVAAIREYQRRANLDDDGRPSDELLTHIEFTGRAIELGVRLEAVKADQMKAAQLALQARPETRALLAARPNDERADLTRDASACFAAPTVACLLTEASESAKGIFDARFRDWALGELVVALSRAGMSDQALATSARIGDPRLIITALRDITSASAEAGRVEQATSMAALIPDNAARARALAAVAAAQARAGGISSATLNEIESLARALSADAEPVAYLVDTALALSRLGATRGAERLVEAARDLVPSAADVAVAKGAVATALAAMGNERDAVDVLDQIPDGPAQRSALAALARARGVAGDASGAQAFAARIGEVRYRATALADAAGAMGPAHADAAQPLLAAAQDQAQTLDERPSFARSHALRAVAVAMAQLGLAAQARDVAATIPDVRLRAEALWIVGAAFAGNDDGRATRERALADTRKLQSGLDRTWVLCGAAAVDVAVGDQGHAREAVRLALDEAKAITDPWGRAQALTRVATTLGVTR